LLGRGGRRRFLWLRLLREYGQANRKNETQRYEMGENLFHG